MKTTFKQLFQSAEASEPVIKYNKLSSQCLLWTLLEPLFFLSIIPEFQTRCSVLEKDISTRYSGIPLDVHYVEWLSHNETWCCNLCNCQRRKSSVIFTSFTVLFDLFNILYSKCVNKCR